MRHTLSPEKKAFLQLMGWTFSLIGLLALGNFLFIMHRVGPKVEIPFSRSIASVPEPRSYGPEAIPPKVTFDCKKEKFKKNWITKASSARILFQNCKKVDEVKNTSNNNQGDLFAMPGKKWTSDFIFLSPGKNQLSLMVQGKSYVIEITREKAPKKQQKAL